MRVRKTGMGRGVGNRLRQAFRRTYVPTLEKRSLRVVTETLPRFVVKHRTAVKRRRDSVFVGNDCFKIGFRFITRFDSPNKAFEAAEPVKFILVPNLSW